MKKSIDIAVKDLTRSLRSMYFLGISLAAPLIMAFIFSSAFGGGSETAIQPIDLAFVDLDSAAQSELAFGHIVREVLSGEGLHEIIILEEVASEELALQGIADKEYTAALIIPDGFTQAIMEEDASTELRVVVDPASTIAPQILENVLTSIADGFSSSKITISLAVEELVRRGDIPDESFYTTVIQQVSTQSRSTDYSAQAYLSVLDPSGETSDATRNQQTIVSVIMVGMMIYFVFYTGASTSESILQEEEQGTLARKFISPTPVSAILGGKMLGVIVTLFVQVLTLVISSGLVFNIDWGDPLKVGIAMITLVIASAGLGSFLMSLLRDTRQTGIVLGGVMTLLGIAGGLFTTGVENPPAIFNTLSRLTPQGWSLELWQMVLRNANYSEMLVPIVVLSAMGIILFSLAVLRFQKRFAKE